MWQSPMAITSGRRNMKKLEKYQGLREKLESMWGVKTTVVIGALGVLIPKLEERL